MIFTRMRYTSEGAPCSRGYAPFGDRELDTAIQDRITGACMEAAEPCMRPDMTVKEIIESAAAGQVPTRYELYEMAGAMAFQINRMAKAGLVRLDADNPELGGLLEEVYCRMVTDHAEKNIFAILANLAFNVIEADKLIMENLREADMKIKNRIYQRAVQLAILASQKYADGVAGRASDYKQEVLDMASAELLLIPF